jgi:hypothetical protein
MPDDKVLRVNPVEERNDYRQAVARILLDIQRDTGATHIDIAEAIGVSLGTISNAANKKVDLCSTYLSRLGKWFGGEYLDPYHALYKTRSVPLEPTNVRDVLPFLARAMSAIAEARDPTSPGGGRETYREKLSYLPELERLQAELAKVICDIRALREGPSLRSVA